MSNARLLLEEKLPYLFTLLVGVIVWGVAGLAQQIGDSPAIEVRRVNADLAAESSVVRCSTTNVEPKAERNAAWRFSNISRQTRFSDVTFMFRLPEGSSTRITGISVQAAPPAHFGRNAERPNCDGEHASVRLPEIHPGWALTVVLELAGDDDPVVHFSDCVEPLRLMPASLVTWLMGHEVALIMGLVVIWVVTLIAYWRFLGARLGLETSVLESAKEESSDAKNES